MDGTLLNHKKQITPETQQAVHSLYSRGYVICIASGRSLPRVLMYADQLPPVFYIVALNGSIIAKFEKAKITILKEFKFGASVVNALVAMTQQDKLETGFYVENTIHICEETRPPTFLRIKGLELKLIDLNKLKNDKRITKIVVMRETHSDLPIAQFTSRLDSFVKHEQQQSSTSSPAVQPQQPQQHQHVYEVYNNESAIEVNPIGVGKHHGLAYLAKHVLKKQKEHLIAFGDNGNDEAMLQYAALSIAPSNATTQVMQLVKVVSKYDNNQDFIARELKQLNCIWQYITCFV